MEVLWAPTSAPPAMDRPSFTADDLNGAVLAAKLDRLATGDMTVISDLLPGMPALDGAAEVRALAEDFGMRVEPRFDGIADASPGVIVIVTKDYEEPRGGK